MEDRVSFGKNAKALLILASFCAFLAIFATFDTYEHYRAWRTARTWTETQKLVAPANDADSMHAIALAALTVDTAVIALSFVCCILLGVAIATERGPVFAAAKGLGLAAIGLGLVFSALMVLYQFKVGSRLVLKGPIFDYDLSMQPPIALAVCGFPLAFLGYAAYRLRHRT